MSATADRSTISGAEAMRWGVSRAAERLSERMATLSRCRWRVMPEGAGLEAIDKRGRRLASLYFEDDADGDA